MDGSIRKNYLTLAMQFKISEKAFKHAAILQFAHSFDKFSIIPSTLISALATSEVEDSMAISEVACPLTSVLVANLVHDGGSHLSLHPFYQVAIFEFTLIDGSIRVSFLNLAI